MTAIFLHWKQFFDIAFGKERTEKMEENKSKQVRRNIGIHFPQEHIAVPANCSCISAKPGSCTRRGHQGSVMPSRYIDFGNDFGVRLWQPLLPQTFVGLSKMERHHATIRPEWETSSLQKIVFSPTFRKTPASLGVMPAPTRHALLLNENVRVFMKYLRPEDIAEEGRPHIRKNTDRHEVLFVHHGVGFFETALGRFHYRDSAYVIMPKGIEYRIVAEEFSSFLIFELKDYPYPVHFVYGDLSPHSFRFSFSGLRVEFPKLMGTEFVKEKIRVMHIADAGAKGHFYDSSPFATATWSGNYYPYLIALDSIHELPFPVEEDNFDRYLTFAAVDDVGRVTSLMYTVRPSHHSLNAYEDVEYDTLWFAHRRAYDDLTEHNEGDLILYPRGNPYRFEDYAGSSMSVVLKTKDRLLIAQGFGSRAVRKGAGEEKRFSRSRSVR